jgi:hypothetical protein
MARSLWPLSAAWEFSLFTPLVAPAASEVQNPVAEIFGEKSLKIGAN